MKRGVCLSRRRLHEYYSTAALARKQPTLSERLKWQPPSRQPIASSEEAIIRSQAHKGSLLRSLSDPPTSAAEWKPDEWKEDWGSDTLQPMREVPREKPPHITPATPKGSPPPPHKRLKKQAPIAYTRKIEGLLDPSEEPILQDLAPSSEHKPIATLEHGLERVLFNPGVHWLQDPRSRVYNFPPRLENLPNVKEFAFERLPGFIKSSRDEDLRDLAKRQNRLFAGSTSSLTGMLSHCYFLMSDHKEVDISSLSQAFSREEKNFTPGQRMPVSVIFNYKDGVYAIDSDSEDSSKNYLTWLGTLLEKFLTMPPAEFSTYLRSSPPLPGEEDPMKEAYRYAKSQKFVMRSQLDCVDRRLPGTGVFDIKTRACLPVRMDILNFEENSGYVIRSAQGLLESFEREYYDLIRSAFLKYGFQVRIGNMDGVIVAYHNTARMFGFQYVSLEEMDQRLFGTEPGAGDRVFQKCVGLLECIASEIIQCYPNQSIKCTFECEEGSRDLNVWAQPVEWTPTGDGAEPPIKQLAVRAQSFIGDTPVKGHRAVTASAELPWTLHWSLSHLSDNQEEIRRNLEKCKDRKFRAYSIPSGVSYEQLPAYWHGLNFGGEDGALLVDALDDSRPFDYSKFRPPSATVERYRELARQGREFSEMMEQMEAGRKKVVLGEPFDISDVEVEAYEAEEERVPHDLEAASALESSESGSSDITGEDACEVDLEAYVAEEERELDDLEAALSPASDSSVSLGEGASEVYVEAQVFQRGDEEVFPGLEASFSDASDTALNPPSSTDSSLRE